MTHRLKQVQRAQDVPAGILDGVRHALADVDLRGQMADDGETAVPHEPRRLRRPDVVPLEPHARRHVLAASSREVVERRDVVAGAQQAVRHVRPNEAGGPGNEMAQENLRFIIL